MVNTSSCLVREFRVSIVMIIMATSLLALGSLEHLEELDEDEDYVEDLFKTNETTPGQFLGSYCADNSTCNPYLRHVYCNKETHKCECAALYPVKLGLRKGCAQSVSLGDQCFYTSSCQHNDPYSECVQIRHNAQCKCRAGFHSVTAHKPVRREFCSKDLVVIKSDLQTLLGVASGLAIFTAAICFVLKLFVGSKPRSFGDANISTPIIYSSNNAIPLRASSFKLDSRASSTTALDTRYIRHGNSNGMLVTSTRAGAAHAAALLLYSCSQIAHQQPPGTARNTANNSRRSSSISPVHSNHSAASFKSFSTRRFERDIEMRLKAAKRRQESTLSLVKPKSTDKLLDDTNKEINEAPLLLSDPCTSFSLEPSTSKSETVHINRIHRSALTLPPEKPLSLPFAKAQSLGQPLSLPLLSSEGEPNNVEETTSTDFQWITTPT
uniref:EB domain-containing protein n=1 Tax=Cacopsylla melanoneura TaxID=428564 RepID=A0A8D8RHY3_9HEMI